MRDRDPPLSLPCRRARGECVVLNLRHFEPILSTQVLVSSVVFVSITAVLHHFWASSPLAGPLTATHCGCASCAMACGGTGRRCGEVGLHRGGDKEGGVFPPCCEACCRSNTFI